MLKDSGNKYLDSVLMRYSTDSNLPSSLSPHLRRKLNEYDDLGLISKPSLSNHLTTFRSQRTLCSIKIGELISPKQRNSMIVKAGIPKILADIKKTRSKEDLIEHSLKKSLTKTRTNKEKPSSNYIESFCSKRGSIKKAKEINPMFYKKINEVIEKSKQVIEVCKKFNNQVKSLKKRTNCRLSKHDKQKIVSTIKLIE